MQHQWPDDMTEAVASILEGTAKRLRSGEIHGEEILQTLEYRSLEADSTVIQVPSGRASLKLVYVKP
jgi:hypothetical protein